MAPPKKKSKNAVDPTWNHCVRATELTDPEAIDNTRLKLVCNYCGKTLSGGVSRMKHHLARTHQNAKPCEKVPEDVTNIFLKILGELKQRNCIEQDDVDCFDEVENVISKRGSMDQYVSKTKAKQVTLPSMLKDRTKPCVDICRMIYAEALPFSLVKSSWFHTAVQSIGEYGKGLKPPSYHEVRVTFLKKEVDNVHSTLDEYKCEWKKTGCSLMSDGWQDGCGHSITNFLVNSPQGTVFLKSLDTSSIIKNGVALFELLDNFVDEIGEENVIQVVTDSASRFVLAGELLMDKRKKLIWSPCAAHCIDLMLKDTGRLPVHHDSITKAKTLTVYIYRHTWVLNLVRKHTKNHNLARPAVTRFATTYLTLKSILTQRIGLRAMFTSSAWCNSSYARTRNGLDVQQIVLDAKFWNAIRYCLKGVLPLVKVLRLVDGDAKPTMGYIYEAMDRAKEQIEKNFNKVKRRYAAIWKIVDERWALQLHRPLHAAAYFLNPRFHYDASFEADEEVRLGLYTVIERMYPSIQARLKLDAQMDKFHNAVGLWWESYGGSCKELQELATRVLSLTCSATGCERNWSTFHHIHSKKRNRLEAQRLNALVFVKYNLTLELRQKKQEENGDAYDPICLSDMESDDEWITEREDPCLPLDPSWMDMNECFEVNEGETSRKGRRGPRNLQNDRKGKRKFVGEENEVEIIDDDVEEEIEEEEEEEYIGDDGVVLGDDLEDDDDLYDIVVREE
ncbi:hypothetical protein RHMOL_Rhmol10G0159300 [Rhododendron molle]|uniref:Uncharacterized protein n=1 Tax=Rhododendron molle TaxID=49168 RepID=A0ACC0M3X5_RHOML|nr:hypothetical protein RHMOL_Rhmol10G0159300 [Rhododendron molle]